MNFLEALSVLVNSERFGPAKGAQQLLNANFAILGKAEVLNPIQKLLIFF